MPSPAPYNFPYARRSYLLSLDGLSHLSVSHLPPTARPRTKPSLRCHAWAGPAKGKVPNSWEQSPSSPPTCLGAVVWGNRNLWGPGESPRGVKSYALGPAAPLPAQVERDKVQAPWSQGQSWEQKLWIPDCVTLANSSPSGQNSDSQQGG